MSYGTAYIDIPLMTRKGGKDVKMSKEIKVEQKVGKKYAKTRGEHYKDIVITVLITGIIAFVAGTVYANKQNSKMNNAVSEARNSIAVTTEAQPKGK